MDYTYLGYTENRQIVKGKVSATDERAATDMLANIGYHVVSLKPATTFVPSLEGFLKGKPKPAEMVTFSRQLAVLLESGVGIIQALELLQTQTPDRTLRKALVGVIHDLHGGISLSASLAHYPHVFSTLYCKMMAVGEQTGSLETVLRSLADYTERQAAAMAKIKQAMMYPVIVFFLGLVVAAIMLLVLLPPLVDMFSKLGGTLPLPTRILLASMTFVRSYGLYMFIGLIAVIIVGLLYTRTPKGRYRRDQLMLRIPVIGRLVLVSNLARSCRSLSLLFQAGVALPEVMALTAEATGNQVISTSFREVEQEMLRGQGLATPMRQRPVFLPMMVEMTRVGEETGTLGESLLVVAENYEIEADRRTQTMLGMIEPAITIAMGLGVGWLALSVFMPIYGALKLVGS